MHQLTGLHFSPTKIILPTDFSPSSDAALETATDLARHFEAELYLLHVIPMLPIVSGMEFPTQFYPEQEFLQDAIKHAEQRLTESSSALVLKGLKASSKVEIGNDVVGNIMMVIEREKIDMIVLSTHGISGWRPIVFGSIAEKVVKLVQCPLLLLRSVKAEAMSETSTQKARGTSQEKSPTELAIPR